MKILKTVKQLRSELSQLKGSIGFVPTMGNLHAGHLSLLEKAKQENDIVILSVFINPTQFNNPDDYNRYPKTLDQDAELAEKAGTNIIFAPEENEMYPDNYNFRINCLDNMINIMEGKYRPGHFEGVLTIVLKLLIITQADKAYFSEKDYQQLYLVQKLTKAYLLKTEIVPCPIIRLKSGLPLSSRNNNLSPNGLQKAEEFAQMVRSPIEIPKIIQQLASQEIKVDYLEDHYNIRFVAAFVEGVRLIDNFPIG
ncbi:pantoate--beta-alanine ligase [Francisellaceae bacterium]|nr:pantoate--beta-alanine ligase [Francisellaceae bacterium]